MGSPGKGQTGALLASAGQIDWGPGSPTTRQRGTRATRRSDDGAVWGGVSRLATTAPSTRLREGKGAVE